MWVFGWSALLTLFGAVSFVAIGSSWYLGALVLFTASCIAIPITATVEWLITKAVRHMR